MAATRWQDEAVATAGLVPHEFACLMVRSGQPTEKSHIHAPRRSSGADISTATIGLAFPKSSVSSRRAMIICACAGNYDGAAGRKRHACSCPSAPSSCRSTGGFRTLCKRQGRSSIDRRRAVVSIRRKCHARRFEHRCLSTDHQLVGFRWSLPRAIAVGLDRSPSSAHSPLRPSQEQGLQPEPLDGRWCCLLGLVPSEFCPSALASLHVRRAILRLLRLVGITFARVDLLSKPFNGVR